MTRTDLLTLADAPRWRALLAETGLGDVYHDPGYLRALADRGEGEPLAFVYRDGDATGLHALLRRPLAALPFAHGFATGWDAGSPYGYAGPVLTTPALAADFWRAWTDAAVQLGIVAEFVRFHPLLENHRPLATHCDVAQAGRTVVWELADDPWRTVGKSRRRDARFAQRQGVVVERAGFDRLPAFGAMYRATMARREAADYYLFDDAYFATLAAGLGDDLRLMRAHCDGRDCAYALCLRHAPYLHYHLSCSDERFAELRAVNLLLIETAADAHREGLTRFHLGGGYRGEDSLFAFKAHFSAQTVPFHVGRAIHDEAAVTALTDRARDAGCAPADPNFFPPYRSGR